MVSGIAPTLMGYDVALAAGIDTVADPPALVAKDMVVEPRSAEDGIMDAMDAIEDAIEAIEVID